MGSNFKNPTESMVYKNIVILIPARFGSTRFPGKPLALINGLPMIQHVYCNLMQEKLDGYHVKAYVVTDDDRIESCVKKFGGQVLRIDDDVPSGSERIFLAYQRFLKKDKPDLIINVQGDEPLLKITDLKDLFDFHLKKEFDIATLVRPRKNDPEGFLNPNRVKAVLARNGKCLYFSRAAIPQGLPNDEWYLHIGVYSYLPESLESFFSLPQSNLEKREKLEQLRALDGGLTIGAMIIKKELSGVDSPEDISIIEGVLSGKND